MESLRPNPNEKEWGGHVEGLSHIPMPVTESTARSFWIHNLAWSTLKPYTGNTSGQMPVHCLPVQLWTGTTSSQTPVFDTWIIVSNSVCTLIFPCSPECALGCQILCILDSNFSSISEQTHFYVNISGWQRAQSRSFYSHPNCRLMGTMADGCVLWHQTSSWLVVQHPCD